jgi:nucleotide-binding universal stress UspA family protein
VGAIGRILYVVTFDSTEALITWQVMELARAAHAEVVLLGLHRRIRWPLSRRPGRDETGRRLSEVAARLKGHAAEIRVEHGPLVPAAMRSARAVDAQLIMIGAGERALREPAYVAPEALELARQARDDVWICKPGADPHIESVLCAADATPAAGAAVLRAAGLCRRFNARLRLLSVMPEPSVLVSDDLEADLHALKRSQKEFLDQFDLRGMPLSRSMAWAADPATEVLHEAGQLADGVLIIGSSSEKRPAHAGLGPTAEAVLRGCPCSIWIVRKPSPGRKKRNAPAVSLSTSPSAAPA